MESDVKKESTWSHPSQGNILVWQLNFSHSHNNIYFKHKLRVLFSGQFESHQQISFLGRNFERKISLEIFKLETRYDSYKIGISFSMHAFSFLLYSIPIWRKVYSNGLRKKKSLHWLTDFIVMYSEWSTHFLI